MADNPLRYVYENTTPVFDELLGAVQGELSKVQANQQLAREMAREKDLLRFKGDLNFRNTVRTLDAQRRSSIAEAEAMTPILVDRAGQTAATTAKNRITTELEYTDEITDKEIEKQNRIKDAELDWTQQNMEELNEAERQQNIPEQELYSFKRDEDLELYKERQQYDKETGGDDISATNLATTRERRERLFRENYSKVTSASTLPVPTFRIDETTGETYVIEYDENGNPYRVDENDLRARYSIAQRIVEIGENLERFRNDEGSLDDKTYELGGVQFVGKDKVAADFNYNINDIVSGNPNEINRAKDFIKDFGKKVRPNVVADKEYRQQLSDFRAFGQQISDIASRYKAEEGIEGDITISELGKAIEEGDIEISTEQEKEYLLERVYKIPILYNKLPTAKGGDTRFINTAWNSRTDPDASFFITPSDKAVKVGGQGDIPMNNNTRMSYEDRQKQQSQDLINILLNQGSGMQIDTTGN